MNLQSINLEDLKAEYFDRTGAKNALKFFTEGTRTWKPMQLGKLLRYHSPKGVYERSEKQRRSELDDLLNSCGVLEIAVLIGFIPPPNGQEFWSTSRQILENRQVQKFFTEHYPLTLPQLMRLRLRGVNSKRLQPTARRTALFMEFLALDQRFRRNHDNDDPDEVMFLDLLDGFYFEDYDFDSFIDDLKKPRKLVESVLLPPAKQTFSHRMLNEFSTFMQFCFDLRDLLKRMQQEPLLQSTVWNHYRYWFVIIGEDLRDNLDQAIKQFAQWKPDQDERAVTSEIKRFMTDARKTVHELTSKKFAGPVDKLLAAAGRSADGGASVIKRQPCPRPETPRGARPRIPSD